MSSSALKNDDFRKLMMTPRVGGDVSTRTSTDNAPTFTHRRSGAGAAAAPQGPGAKASSKSAKAEKYKKKAAAGAAGGANATKKKKDPEEDSLLSIMKGYRDRAKERRGQELQVDAEAEADMMKLQGGHFHGDEIDDRRQTAIDESKYLGGDMEHTHLVKGLDYALLQKVRSELTDKVQEEDTLETLFVKEKKNEQVEVASTIKSMMARNIHSLLFTAEKSSSEPVKPLSLFAPRRMAYIMHVAGDEQDEESDIPTTLIRSKADCPVEETASSAAVNDTVIAKLSQVLGYLRADTGNKHKKRHGKETEASIKPAIVSQTADKKGKVDKAKDADIDIYDDIGEYKPTVTKSSRATDTSRGDKDKSSSKRRYFDDSKDSTTSRDRSSRGGDDRRDRDRRGDRDGDRQRSSARRSDRDGKDRNTRDPRPDDRLKRGWAPADIARERDRQAQIKPNKPADKPAKPKPTLDVEEDSYMECYPSTVDRLARLSGSEDEEIFAKLDRKSTLRMTRLDFETEDQYAEYCSTRDTNPALSLKTTEPKVRSKKAQGEKKEKDGKQKFEREWNEINKILEKRKDSATPAKLPKY